MGYDPNFAVSFVIEVYNLSINPLPQAWRYLNRVYYLSTPPLWIKKSGRNWMESSEASTAVFHSSCLHGKVIVLFKFVIEKLLYSIITLNYATLIINFPIVLPPVRSRCAF